MLSTQAWSVKQLALFNVQILAPSGIEFNEFGSSNVVIRWAFHPPLAIGPPVFDNGFESPLII